MTALRTQFIAYLQTQEMSPRTQTVYVHAVRQLAEHYHLILTITTIFSAIAKTCHTGYRVTLSPEVYALVKNQARVRGILPETLVNLVLIEQLQKT